MTDPYLGEISGDPYATRHNPFRYFHSVVDDTAYCNGHDVDLTGLASDLKRIASTPNYSFITPAGCGDGHDTTFNADPPAPAASPESTASR